LKIFAFSSSLAASYAVSVRQASVLPAASSGFHLAMDTLAVRLTIPPAGFVRDFHPQMSAPCRAHKEKVEESGTANDGDYFYSCASLLTSIPESVSALTAERRPPKAKSNPVWWAVEAKKQETGKRIAVDRARRLFL
jgi:hypothetical protein